MKSALSFSPRLLTISIVATLAIAGPAAAQRAQGEPAKSKIQAEAAAQVATDQAEAARASAQTARDATHVTGGTYSTLHQQADAANDAANEAVNAAHDARGAQAAAQSSANPKRGAAEASQAANAATDASLQAQAAADAAVQQAYPQPAPAPAASAPPAYGPVKQEVHATSSPPNSTLANKVDFDALDANRDGNLSRTEVAADATLTADFAALDANRDGRITKRELAGGK